MYKCPWTDADGNACTGVHMHGDVGTPGATRIVCQNDGKSWDVDAPLGPWCVTWDIPNTLNGVHLESEATRLKRSVIATWQPVRMWQGEIEPTRAKKYKAKSLGYVYF